MNAILSIARYEFLKLVRSSLILIVFLTICAATIINAAGCTVLLPEYQNNVEEPFLIGFSNIFYFSSLFFSILVLCVGIISFSSERSGGRLTLLLTKPVYRRDIVLGKLLGMNVLIFILVSLFILLNISSIMIAYGGPKNAEEVLLKILTFGAGLYLYCSLLLGIMSFFGIVFKELIVAITISISYLILEWFAPLQNFYLAIGDLRLLINPLQLYFSAFGSLIAPLNFTIIAWADSTYVMIILIILEIVVVYLAGCILMNRET